VVRAWPNRNPNMQKMVLGRLLQEAPEQLQGFPLLA
jgi:hypothetical protein